MCFKTDDVPTVATVGIGHLHLTLVCFLGPRFETQLKDFLDAIGRVCIRIVPLVQFAALLARFVGQDALLTLFLDRFSVEVVEAELAGTDGTIWREEIRVDGGFDVQADLRCIGIVVKVWQVFCADSVQKVLTLAPLPLRLDNSFNGHV